jgi:ABC-type polysaccharide transport system permease subunit
LPEVFVDTRDNAPLIAAGGGLLLFISLFMTWAFDASAWETFDFVDVILAVIALIAIAIGVMLVTGNTTNLPSSPGTIVSTASLIAFSIVAAFVIELEERGFGIFLALIGTIAMIVGGMQLARGVAEPRTRVAEPAAPPPPPPPSTGV